ncbi:hypothetical protein ALC62_15769 [Cyphomyrmex costatus]|uniref:Uncharacterized protein n=1 Tax=Cyphomyrmex costatus TaxID=456900 RepID=A0A151I697_9HYME|nr:hypothetical protein ALC62_15769 [Cyphomyrmex costatus]
MHHTAPWYLPWGLKLVPLPIPPGHPASGIPNPGLHLLTPLPGIYAPEPRKRKEEARYCSRGTCSLVRHADTTNLHVFRSWSMCLSVAAYTMAGTVFRSPLPFHRRAKTLVALRFCELRFSGVAQKTEESQPDRGVRKGFQVTRGISAASSPQRSDLLTVIAIKAVTAAVDKSEHILAVPITPAARTAV